MNTNTPRPQNSLSALLTSLEQVGEDRTALTLAEVVTALGARGFGPLLIVLAILIISPVALVPGMPAICGLSLMLVGGHMLVGRRHLWLPVRLGRVTISTALLRSAVARLRQVLNVLHPIIGQRTAGLSASALSVALIGIASAMTGMIIVLIGFIPGLPFTLAWHLLAFGLGLALRDGILVALGWLLLAPEVALIAWLWP